MKPKLPKPLSEPEERLAQHIRAARLPTPSREARFHVRRRWRFDFAWFGHRPLAVEVEGGIWSGGRHTRGKGFADDCEKYNEAAIAGWCVLRVTPQHIRSGQAIKWIERGLRNV